MKRETEGRGYGRRPRRQRLQWTTFRFVLGRLDRGNCVSLTSFLVHLSPRASFSIFSIVLCPPVCSFPNFSLTSFILLSSVLLLLSLPFLSLSPLCISLTLTFRPFSSFFASVVPYISRFLSGTLCAALCIFFFLSRSSISFSFCPRHAFRPRAGRTDRACSRLSWPPHGLQDRVRGRSLLLCSGRCGDPRKEKEKERERGTATPKHEREERDRYDYYSRTE